MTGSPSLTNKLTRVTIVGNLSGALLAFAYFNFLDPSAHEGAPSLGWGVGAFFIVSFAILSVIGRTLGVRWARPVVSSGGPLPEGAEGRELRRRALLVPGFFALLSFVGWIAASLIWGVLWPLLIGQFTALRAVRQIFGLAFVAGPVVTAIVFFSVERIWREELPRLFPQGDLSTVEAPRLRVRTRMVAMFLLISLMPIAVLSVAALTRANAMLGADAQAAEAIIRNLILVVAALAIGGFVVSVRLAGFVAGSVAGPLRDVQAAMADVGRGSLDVRCAVVSNDEIGEVAEGFNRMVAGLREREQIRETFGKYVSPEVRDEILAGRASLAGGLREVTILFADLRDFTPWVESSPPADVVADLNEYFTEMDAAIRAQGGLVLQFIGDEIEAVFGAPIADPGHARSAVRAAIEMRSRLENWNAARIAAGKIALRHGIGIHTGTVIAGNIGSSERLSYALVGDAVNLTSRIQALNKEFGTHILVSGVTVTKGRLDAAAPGGEKQFILKALPTVRVKGRSAEVEVYSLE
jgi:adenylate cyclase